MTRYTLFWNSLSGTILYVIGGASAFMMAPFLVHHLTNSGYGFWELLMGLAGYLGILDLGVSPAVLRYVALARGEGNHTRLVQIINTGFKTFLLAGILGASIMLVVAIRPHFVFGDLPLPLNETRVLISLAALIFFISFIRVTFTASLMGLQMARSINAIRAVLTIGQSAAVYLLLTHNNEHALIKVATVTVISAAIETLICAGMLWRLVGGGLSPARGRWGEARELFSFGLKSVGIMASSSLMRQGMLFVIAHVAGPAAVTFYVLSSRLIDYGQALVSAVGYPITPYLAGSFGRDGVSGAAAAWDFTTRAMQFIQAGVAMGVFWLGLPFLAVWMGPDYAVRGAPVFYVLIIGTLMQTFGVNAGRMLVSLNRHGKIAIGGSFFAAGIFLLSVFTVPHWGLPAAAAGLMGYAVLMNLWELFLVSRALAFSLPRHLAGTIRECAPPILAGSAALYGLQVWWPATSYLRLPAHAAVGGGVYTLVSLFTLVSTDERAALWRRLEGLIARVGLARRADLIAPK